MRCSRTPKRRYAPTWALVVSTAILTASLPISTEAAAGESARPTMSDRAILVAYQKGYGAFERKDYDKAVKWSRMAAEQGDPRAQSIMGWLYAYGLGIEKDEAEAMNWYHKAASQGLASAQAKMGHIYARAIGVARNDEEAIFWYSLAAAQGHDNAQASMGWMYENGRGLPQDLTKAENWYRKAVRNGNKWAAGRLERWRKQRMSASID